MSLKGLRALVVDDRETTRDMLLANLQGSGAIVDCGTSETEALSKLAEAERAGAPYNVVIIDRVRPRMSGLHLCRTIRSTKIRSYVRHRVDVGQLEFQPHRSAWPRQFDLAEQTRPPHRSSGRDRTHPKPCGGCRVRSRRCRRGNTRSPRTQAPSMKLRVLLVEDNLTNIEVAREYLNEYDCRVTVAMNGIEAIAAYDRSNFDIILMDSQMPELDGLSATRRIRESERLRGLSRTPIVAVTANAYESDRIQAIEAGSDDFLSKPYSEPQLRGMLQKWGIDQRQATSTAPQTALVPADKNPHARTLWQAQYQHSRIAARCRPAQCSSEEPAGIPRTPHPCILERCTRNSRLLARRHRTFRRRTPAQRRTQPQILQRKRRRHPPFGTLQDIGNEVAPGCRRRRL